MPKMLPHVLRITMLACAILLLTMHSVWAAENFTPYETPGAVSVTTSSSSVSFTLTSAINAPDVKVNNCGSTEVYFVCGNSSAQATVPGAGSTSTGVGSSKTGVYHKGSGATTCAAIVASSTGCVEFTAGQGE